MAWMYILECSDGTFYTGSTIGLEARLWQHQNGLGANYTRDRLPVRVAFAEQFERIEDAFAMEKKIQHWSHAKKLALIEGRFDDLKELSKKPKRGVRA